MKLVLAALALLIGSQAHAIDFKSPSTRFTRYDSNSNGWSMTFPGESYDSGYSCFKGEWTKISLPQQIVYRVKIENNAREDFFIVKMDGYFVNAALTFKNATPITDDIEGEPRTKFCRGNYIDASLMGHKVGFEFIIQKTGAGPAAADVILDESETNTLTAVYGPIFREALAKSNRSMFDLPFFGSAAYKDVDNKDPIAVAIAAMNHAKTVDPTVIRGDSIPVLTLTDSF